MTRPHCPAVSSPDDSGPDASLPLHTTLRDGTPVIVRWIRAGDGPQLVAGLERLSPQTRYQRFLCCKSGFTADELRYLTDCDGINHLALIAAVSDEEGIEVDLVAVARCIREGDASPLAEVAIVVLDAYHGRGIGTILFQTLAQCAWNVGIRYWYALLLNDNAAAFRLMAATGTKQSQQSQGLGLSLVMYELHRASHSSHGSAGFDDAASNDAPKEWPRMRETPKQIQLLLVFSIFSISGLLIACRWKNSQRITH